MIQTLEIKLKVPENIKLTQSACSLFHGVLMESIDPDYAEVLHRQSLRPYSQYLYFDKVRNGLYWRLTALNKQAKNELLAAVFELSETIYLKQKNIDVQILSREYLPAVDYGMLAEKYFANSLKGKYLCCNFLTACGFKSEGQYVIFPQGHFLINSLLKRWNTFADNEKLESQGIVQDLAKEVYVADYQLYLHPFSVDGVRIPAFKGKYVLGLKNNLMCNRIIAMLGEYSNYSGIGIKTALGMGAVNTMLQERY